MRDSEMGHAFIFFFWGGILYKKDLTYRNIRKDIFLDI